MTNPLSCQCCALAVANGDTSGCETYCGDAHVERLAGFGEMVTIGETDDSFCVFRCAGCGDDTAGTAFVVHYDN